MSPFCLLRDPQTYVAHDYDLLTDAAHRQHWLDLFANHFTQALVHAATQYGRTSKRQIAQASQKFAAQIETLRTRPDSLPSGKLNVIELCRVREQVLREHRIGDPFKHIKDRENAAAIKLYPQVVRRIRAMKNTDRWLHLIRCVFAGNVFDLGAASTMHLAHQQTDFIAQGEQTKPRPWLVDDFDRLRQDLPDRPPTKWAKAVVFVDNAGCDFVLGVMPLVRELGLMGTKVVLAANDIPSLNDITANETVDVLRWLSAVDADLAALIEAGMLEVVASGNDIPLIDLSKVSDELNEAAADAELVIIEGMGRAVESNLNAQFKVATLKLALIKDPMVAKNVGGELYDCVCKYEPA